MHQIDAVIWTDLENNFEQRSISKKPFSVPEAILHLNNICTVGKLTAAEYVRKAPDFVKTTLRTALQSRYYLDHMLVHEEIAIASYLIRENENRRRGFEEHGRDIEDWFSAQGQLKRRFACVE